MNFIAEQPLLVSIMLGILVVGLIYAWLQTGKREAGIAGLVFALLIPVAWVVAERWETDREQIERMIYETADLVENNQFDDVYDRIADEETRGQAETELPNFEFTVADVNRINLIQVIEGSFPLEADVEMSVRVVVSDLRGRFRDFRAPRRLVLRLQKLDGQWRVIDYRHLPMVGGPDNFTTQP